MFKNVWLWFKSIFGDAAKALEKPAETVNKIVNVIKDYVSNPLIDIFTSLTRTGIDNAIIDRIRMYLPDVLSGMLKAENIIKDLTKGDIGSLLRLFADYLNGISAAARGKWWVELAALLLSVVTNKQVPKPMSIAVTQATYLKNAANANL